MKSKLPYTAFNHKKSLNELLFYTSLWQSELEFIKIELSFIKKLIKTYPFKSEIPNLFEHLQLFILDIDNFEENRNSILVNIHIQKNNLKKDLKYSDFDYDNLAEEIFNYKENYKNLKIKIYQYINGLIN